MSVHSKILIVSLIREKVKYSHKEQKLIYFLLNVHLNVEKHAFWHGLSSTFSNRGRGRTQSHEYGDENGMMILE